MSEDSVIVLILGAVAIIFGMPILLIAALIGGACIAVTSK